MSSAATPAPQPQPAPVPAAPPVPKWEPLSPLERRLLGVLVEKQKTSKTADSYPLTLNSLVTGCNQKSNRDPVFELDEVEVEEGLEPLQERGLVTRITGGRVDRFRHELYDRWTQSAPGLAVLAELLLRGPQTKSELRTRAARMAPTLDSHDVLDEVLKPLLDRWLVVHLTEPDRRGAVVSHGFHTPEELPRLKVLHAGAPASVSVPEPPALRSSPPPDHAFEARWTTAVAEIDSLKARVAVMEAQLAELRKPSLPAP